MPALPDDRELMVRTARGDRDALGALYDRHGSMLLGLAMRILHERREAEDLLHDVFVEVWRCAGDYDPARGSVRSWLALRTRSRSLDRVRSARSRRTAAEPPADDAVATSSTAESAADAGRVRSALGGLSPPNRQVLEMGYFGGLSCSEIAHELGIPIGTVKSRVRVAIAQLRASLGSDREAS